jgi:P27 family predicted phage terminase small subunit
MSRRAKPTALKVIEGRAGARRALASEPTPKPAVDAEPTFPLSDRGRELFDAARRELESLGMLGSLDVPVLTLWADQLATYEDVSKAARAGVWITDRDGSTRRNMAIGMARDLAASVKRLGTELGMTPVSRVGMKVANRNVPSLEDLLAGRR